MHTLQTLADYQAARATLKGKIGLVPTMGALHAGHLSLIEAAKKDCDHVVVSLFINPLQFGPTEDFNRYPRTLESDQDLCESAGVTLLFAPTREGLYPEGEAHATKVWIPELGKRYCGVTRPVFFEGVLSVVLRLLNALRPHFAYFGEKDFQQLVLIQKMARDLFLDLKIIGCPIVREPSGLAMSSRNKYLTDSEKEEAAIIYKALSIAKKSVEGGKRDWSKIKAEIVAYLHQHSGIQVDYCDCVDSQSLDALETVKPGARVLFAGVLNQTRLIDNLALS